MELVRDLDTEIRHTERLKKEALKSIPKILGEYVNSLNSIVALRDFEKAETEYLKMKQFLKRRSRFFDTLNMRLERLRDKKEQG